MALKSLKSKLLIAVSTLVIASGMLISVLVTQRFTESLLAAITAQAESLAHAVALESTEKILVNDLVALQKMLDHQMKSNPSLAYLFVLREGHILAHTFKKGVPTDLINANTPLSGDEGRLQEIASKDGERYLDIVWPIFSGRAGVLRLGFSQEPFRRQVGRLWLQMSLITLGILLLALTGSLIFVKRITRPLAALAQATREIDKGDLDIKVRVTGNDEVAALASSFNQMISRINHYTTRLENQARELERSHSQTRTWCEIATEIGSLPTLHEIGPALIKRFQDILVCRDMALLVLNEERQALFVLGEKRLDVSNDPGQIEVVAALLDQHYRCTFFDKPILGLPILPEGLPTTTRQAIVPFRGETQIMGALLIWCPGGCGCDLAEIEMIGLILNQAAGVINRAILQEEAIQDLQRRIEASAEFCGIIGKDSKMQVVYRLIEDIAPTDATVLIQGESGTGKELVARAIHQRSDRKDGSFVVINCSAYPDTLLESELFGHEKGAFTGAVRQRAGRFELAHGGTVFLDEIGEIPAQAQIKLLRVLQTQQFERLGGERTVSVNVRILAATNKDLLQEVKKGSFREDLYYRLNVIPIVLPPLRDRRNDVPVLANHFMRRFAAEQGKKIERFSQEAMRVLLDYSWPGNVRELENSVEHSVVLAKGTKIEPSDLPAALRNLGPSPEPRTGVSIFENERSLLEHVLEECDWNKKEAAKRLGIGRNTLYAKLKKHRLEKPTMQ